MKDPLFDLFDKMFDRQVKKPDRNALDGQLKKYEKLRACVMQALFSDTV